MFIEKSCHGEYDPERVECTTQSLCYKHLNPSDSIQKNLQLKLDILHINSFFFSS